MAERRVLSKEERERFLGNLPWSINGTLPDAEQAWMRVAIAESSWAAAAADRERCLVQSVAAPDPTRTDLGLGVLMDRVRQDATVSPATGTPGKRSPRSPGSTPSLAESAWRLLGRLAQPRFAGAMAVVLVLQTGVIGWLINDDNEQNASSRSTPVTELRTLRVTISPGASEVQLRSALIAAGARIVGGPNQLGEYWLASEIRSLDEVKASLQASGLTISIEVDTAGPRGR